MQGLKRKSVRRAIILADGVARPVNGSLGYWLLVSPSGVSVLSVVKKQTTEDTEITEIAPTKFFVDFTKHFV